MLNKKYHIQVFTPLGIETALLSISSSNSMIEINKGSAALNLLEYNQSGFVADLETDVPFECKITIKATTADSKINGHLYLDSYLVVQFAGEETDGKSIPGLR